MGLPLDLAFRTKGQLAALDVQARGDHVGQGAGEGLRSRIAEP